MPYLFWAAVVIGAIGINWVVKVLRREKYAELAAHMAQSEATDAQISGATNLGNATAQGTIPGGFKGDVPF